MITFKSFRFGKPEAIIISAFIFLVLLGLGVATIPIIATWYGALTKVWTQLALHYGYWGAFVSALIGSLTIVIVFPYTIIIIFLAAQGLNPLYLGLLMALGATIGQMSGYLVGRTGSRFVRRQKPETYEAIKRIVDQRPNFVQALLFVFALIPLPDDVVFVPLGLIGYPWWKIILPTLAGKVITGMLVTSFGFFFRQAIDTSVAGPATAIVSQLATFAVIALMVYVYLKLDWSKMTRRFLKSDPAARVRK